MENNLNLSIIIKDIIKEKGINFEDYREKSGNILNNTESAFNNLKRIIETEHSVSFKDFIKICDLLDINISIDITNSKEYVINPISKMMEYSFGCCDVE